MATGTSPVYQDSSKILHYKCDGCRITKYDLDTEAQHFCPECEAYVCDKCEKIHGRRFKKHIVHGPGFVEKWAGFSMDRCDQHGNQLEVHCDDHQKLCCSICVSQNHSQCSRKSPLSDLCQKHVTKAQFKKILTAADSMRNRLDELKGARTEECDILKELYKNIIAEINTLRKEMNDIFDEIEKQTLGQLDSMMKDLEKAVKGDTERCALMNDQLEILTKKLRQIKSKRKETTSDTSPYIGYSKCQAKLTEAEDLVKEIEGKPNHRILFYPESKITTSLKSFKTLGSIEKVQAYKTYESKEYPVRIISDTSTLCNIVGICETSDGDIVIADSFNRKVKLLNSQYQVIAHCDILIPSDICHTKGNEVAVAVHGSSISEVQFLTVTNGCLKAVRKFRTNYHSIYSSIAHYQGHLYLGSTPALYQYTVEGQLVKKMHDHLLLWSNNKFDLSADGEKFFVAASQFNGKHHFMTFDRSGDSGLLYGFDDPDLEMHSRVSVSARGHVFVCGRETIVQLDKEGRRKVTVVRLSDPLPIVQSLWFSENTSSLIVGHSVKDTITVYKLC